ncbi:MAG: hypothetical protein KC419_14835, partial [Anaerolineales bacterium]|nr:hypothetical protein [Anaerolineales bacterium]
MVNERLTSQFIINYSLFIIMSTTTPGNLLHNLLLFGRLLRTLGLDINPGRMIDLVDALRFVEIGHRSDFYFTVRSLLVHNREDLSLFDRAFALFWRQPDRKAVPFGVMERQSPTTSESHFTPPTNQQTNKPTNQQTNKPTNQRTQLTIHATRTYSRREIL